MLIVTLAMTPHSLCLSELPPLLDNKSYMMKHFHKTGELPPNSKLRWPLHFDRQTLSILLLQDRWSSDHPNYFWNHSLNGLKWSHLTDMGCVAIEMVPHISLSSWGTHLRKYVQCQLEFLMRKNGCRWKCIKAQIASDHCLNLAPPLLPPYVEGAMGN